MNRRNFIKSASVIVGGFPFITAAFENPPYTLEPLKHRPWGDYVKIMDIDELKQEGIRSAIYSASCVDRDGVLAHEKGFDFTEGHIERFVRKVFVVQSLPQYWIGKYWHDEATGKVKDQVVEMVNRFRDGHKVYMDGREKSLEESIREIKKNMEYVCLFEYVYFPEVKEEAWPAKWMPVVGGLTKKRYQQHIKELNE